MVHEGLLPVVVQFRAALLLMDVSVSRIWLGAFVHALRHVTAGGTSRYETSRRSYVHFLPSGVLSDAVSAGQSRFWSPEWGR